MKCHNFNVNNEPPTDVSVQFFFKYTSNRVPKSMEWAQRPSALKKIQEMRIQHIDFSNVLKK